MEVPEAESGTWKIEATALDVQPDEPAALVLVAFDAGDACDSVWVRIDIMPGSERNPENRGPRGVIPVVILGSRHFPLSQHRRDVARIRAGRSLAGARSL